MNTIRKEQSLFEILEYYFSKEKEHHDNSYRDELSREIMKFLIETDDGSYTLKSPEFDGKSENMHNSHGAITESFEKFVKPLKFSYEKEIAILDICSGFGYNSAAAIENFTKNKKDTNEKIAKLKIDMIEISIETLAIALTIPSPIPEHKIIKKAIESKLIDEDFAKLSLEKCEIPENININIFCEDARKTIESLEDNSYDAIFLDPFSPAWTPELCTVEFFIELKRVLKDDGMIATYSAAAPLRYGFIEAGFHIGEGPAFGRKFGGTIASTNIDKIDKSISKSDERTIALSDAGIPFRDPGLNKNSNEILEFRAKEREKTRHFHRISSAVQTSLFLGEEISDEKLKRRVLRNLSKVNIPTLKSKEANYIIFPQNSYLVTSNHQFNSRNRIIDMNNRLLEVIKGLNFKI
ncbi:tRNA 5-methylaminomethyl-2-thiouridine biosynthesis bifunctional protein MnmC [Methanobrevibacter cuticularis]|uniref:tRNA 5-methylaminomethyl-2-thiouridine biosynthesis bifunctional protein MnmC n=1 Tax=Methanobrevibacter cuticularis TaxID=47311 RepID=A0A166DXX1_9EURY|nr:MnmC family methyltransferase [Methanobrevibacter cuticularis]KZX16070.1 tRNA 5-methylaminomethyl-2-thiouridine biosynthesis bifunctional protein MnmC [Methanobrevibacter cuticularis]